VVVDEEESLSQRELKFEQWARGARPDMVRAVSDCRFAGPVSPIRQLRPTTHSILTPSLIFIQNCNFIPLSLTHQPNFTHNGSRSRSPRGYALCVR
jgi:hypothetical protein